jgi:hypothetical protein
LHFNLRESLENEIDKRRQWPHVNRAGRGQTEDKLKLKAAKNEIDKRRQWPHANRAGRGQTEDKLKLKAAILAALQIMRLPILVACGLLAFSGLVHGLWTDRWSRPEALERALARVADVPLALGPWQGKEVVPEDAESFRRAGAQAYRIVNYTHAEKKTSISVVLMCGRAGRMAVHTPEVCYQGAGYELAEAPVPMPLKSARGESVFWTARFNKTISTSADLRLCWAWNAAGDWQAPPSPRWAFRGLPFLYKLYVIQEIRASAADDEALGDFFHYLVPALRTALFAEIPS